MKLSNYGVQILICTQNTNMDTTKVFKVGKMFKASLHLEH